MIKWCVQLDMHLLHRGRTIWSKYTSTGI